MRRRPMTSLVAHTLGSAIAIESILVFSLGVLLLYFACKCAIVLVHDKRRPAPRDIELSRYKVPVRELLFRQLGHGESSKDIHHSSQSSSDHHEGLSSLSHPT